MKMPITEDTFYPMDDQVRLAIRSYCILAFDPATSDEHFRVVVDTDKQTSNFPWNIENAPIQIKVKAKEIPSWQLYNEMTGPLPYSTGQSKQPVEEITLIPYGCTTLRVCEFPLVR